MEDGVNKINKRYMKIKDIFYDIFYLMVISIPSLIYIIPWVLDTNPSLGVDSYGGGSILLNKTLAEVIRGYFPDWYLGINFVLFPVKFVYWAVLKGLSFISSNPFTVIKLSYVFTFFLSIITSYMVIKKLYKNRIYGILGSLLYVYAPYHLSWNGIEAIWSLSLFYAIFPLAFYYLLEFMIELNTENKINNIKLLLSSLSIGLINFTHPQSFLLLALPFFALFSILYTFFVNVNKQKKFILIKMILLSFFPIMIAFLIGTFWWLPAMVQDDIMTRPDQSLDLVKTTSLPFLSIITLQGRTWTIPTFKDFFYSESEFAVAVILTVIIWTVSLYGMKGYINRKIFWIPAAIISSFPFILLAMGPLSPIPLYTWFYNHIPFFSNIRTPGRWLSVIILIVSLVFPSGIERLSKISSIFKITGYCLIIVLILANSATELGYAFKNFNLDQDIYQHYELLSSVPNGTRILTVPMIPNNYYIIRTNIEDGRRNPSIVDPRLWNFMYGEKENFLGGSPESLSVKELGERGEYISMTNNLAKIYSVNLSMMADIYGIDYLWIDNTKKIRDARLVYYEDDSTIKLLETENYTLYKNINAFPRILLLGEDIIELNEWKVDGEGNGTIVSSNSITIQYNDTVGESKYIRYLKAVPEIGELDELFGEYNISGAIPQSITLNMKFVDEKERIYTWIKNLDTSKGAFRIPVFWFQPEDKSGTALNVKDIKLLGIGIIESSSDIKSEKKKIVIELKNLALLKHQQININLPYQKLDNMKYNVILPEINNYSKVILVFNYAYNPDIKLALNETFIDGYKIFGFLNAFDIPYSGKEMKGTIEYKQGKSYYYGAIISLVTIISLVSYIYIVGNRLKK